MKERSKSLSRRNFLLAVGAGGVATATAIVANAPSASSSLGGSKRRTRGYQASEHVGNYYRTAKV